MFCFIAATAAPGAWLFFGRYDGGWVLPVELILGLLSGAALGELARYMVYETRGDEFIVRLWCVGWRLRRYALADLAKLERRQALLGDPTSALLTFRSGKSTEIPAGHHGSQELIQHLEDRLEYNTWKAGTP